MPFQGELMTCAMCGRQEWSNPKVQSGWTLIQLPGSAVQHYVCPPCIHEPAKQKGYKLAYSQILRNLIDMEKKQ